MPTPKPTPAPRYGSPEDVARLRAWLPSSVRKSCATAALTSTLEVAALRCEADDVKVLRYALHPDASALRSRWNAFVAAAKIAPGGRCESGEEAAGAWADEGIFGIFGETRGSLACTVNSRGDARIDWTTVDAPIWATLWRDDEDIAAAYATWLDGRLNPLRKPR